MRLLSLIYQRILLAFALLQFCQGFSPETIPRRTTTSSSSVSGTQLKAWSLPSPPSPWYEDEVNPCSRKIVYNDSPLEYKFVTPGNDWFADSSSSSSATSSARSRRQRMNPLRRVARFVKRWGVRRETRNRPIAI